ncbi:hypothetical protein DFH11DRAFT_841128 [Phellopilus nigrolimitatus]|nr:hypothetical protein DFH11DRAFT_841128 [Phellopilus nigrolimitatus]
MAAITKIVTPVCKGLSELPSAAVQRAQLNEHLLSAPLAEIEHTLSPSLKHIALGLALTTGSALGETPPTEDQCLSAFTAQNAAGLTSGARAWSKHARRSAKPDIEGNVASKPEPDLGWWGTPKGPVQTINMRALELFWRIMRRASWKNLHWLPHAVLVYEVRVEDGYGMRWSQNRPVSPTCPPCSQWIFRGFVEPMMEDGHKMGWMHSFD